jgi:hypothetical protein
MDWKSVVSKNSDKNIEPIDKLDEDIIDKNENIIKDNNSYLVSYLDIDDEFDFAYSRKISYIKEEFKDFINFHALPFMDKHMNIEFNFYDFIKNNSLNYLKIEKKVVQHNDDIDKEIAEENKYSDEDDYE